MSPPSTDPTCNYHQSSPAIAVCAECGADMCGACHGFDARGFALCPACRGGVPDTRPDWEAESTAYTPRAYASTLWEILRSPRAYFGEVSARGPWLPAVIFGFISVTFGLLVDRLWKFTFETGFQATLSEYTAAQELTPDELQLLAFLSVPLSALLAGAVHIGALKVAIEVAGADSSWSTTARIGGYALASYLFLLIPPVAGFPLGHLLAVVWLFNLEASALRSLYGFGPWKATGTVIVPAMLLMTCGG